MDSKFKSKEFLKRVDLRNEEEVNSALTKAGLYSNLPGFPLAAIQLELTEHCNEYCKHCYNNSGCHNSVPDIVTPEKWVDFAKYLVENGGVFEAILSGGEPLLLGDTLFQIMDILHNDGTCFMLDTNGYLLTDEVAKKLKKYRYHWLQISLDGVRAEYHDFFRQRKGSWQSTVNGVKVAVSNGIPVKIAHCITPHNLMDIDEMCDFAYSLGVSQITVGELCLSGRTAYNIELLLSQRQKEYFRQKVKENAVKYKGRMIVKGSNSVRLGLKRHYRRPSSCAIIRPNGDIRIDGLAPFVIGNILEDDFKKVWTNRLLDAWRDQRVLEYIEGFGDDDRNHSFVNYVDQDVYL